MTETTRAWRLVAAALTLLIATAAAIPGGPVTVPAHPSPPAVWSCYYPDDSRERRCMVLP